MNEVLFSSNTDDWATPQDLFDALDAEFHFTLDPCSGERYQDRKGLQMIEKIKKFIRIITILLMTTLVIFLIYTVFKYEWKNILCFVSVITVVLIICWAFDW